MKKQNSETWGKIIRLLNKEGCKKKDHPKVSAIIILKTGKDNEKNNLKIEGIHHCNNSMVCIHAEEEVLNKLIKKIADSSISLSSCDFYTSLEPCNQRKRFKVPCAHRISTIGFNKVSIGMMDPNPEVFGRGVAYLAENIGNEKIEFADNITRSRIQKKNRLFINGEKKKFSIYSFKEGLPVFTGLDEELYLKIAYALFGNYEGKLIWLFPRLPSFSDKNKFHAVWAQGILENKKLKEVYIIVHNKVWKEDIKDAIKNNMIDTLIDEFAANEKKRTRPIVRLILKRHYNKRKCWCDLFKGALLINKEDKIDLLIMPSYTKIENNWISTFLVCEPKYILSIINKNKSKQEDMERFVEKLNGMYKTLIMQSKSLLIINKIREIQNNNKQ